VFFFFLIMSSLIQFAIGRLLTGFGVRVFDG